jgi:hypothetical protein
MRRKTTCLVALIVALAATPALADFFALELDGQLGYLRITNIARPDNFTRAELAGATAGAHAKLEILFLSVFADYQHFFSGADYLYAGLGMDFKLPLSVIEPYVRGSIGPMVLSAAGAAFDPDATEKLNSKLGLQVKAGAGLDIPLGSWFAIGAVCDVGYHYLTGLNGFDLAVMGYLGLRI